MLTVDQLRERARKTVGLGGPDGPPVPAAEVLPHLDSGDRNVRVAALRVLAFSDEPAVADGIIRGLDDPVKRVREVAAKSSIRFLGDQRVIDRLRRAVEDDETGSCRPALEILGGVYHAPYGLMAVEPVAEAMAALAAIPAHRQQVLASLLRARALTDDVAAVLRDFVRDGSKEEAVAATRRLCGLRIERRELIDEDILRTAEPARGHLWYWIRAD